MLNKIAIVGILVIFLILQKKKKVFQTLLKNEDKRILPKTFYEALISKQNNNKKLQTNICGEQRYSNSEKNISKLSSTILDDQVEFIPGI